jgi:hypothetical protein
MRLVRRHEARQVPSWLIFDVSRKYPVPHQKSIWKSIRRVWASLGLVALLGFTVWCLVAYRATGEARESLRAVDKSSVYRSDHHWVFAPSEGTDPQRVGLLFFPGAMVEAAAYAPLVRSVARAGFPAVLVDVPRRGVWGGADGPEVVERAHKAIADVPSVSRWVLAGHSRGGAVAARLARDAGLRVAGLVLVGTSHPRDFSIADLQIPVTKILGSRDGVSPVAKSETNKHLLPASTRWVMIEGGNHSQFGLYGFQPGDRFASIDRTKQQSLTVEAILSTIRAVVQENRANKAPEPTPGSVTPRAIEGASK